VVDAPYRVRFFSCDKPLTHEAFSRLHTSPAWGSRQRSDGEPKSRQSCKPEGIQPSRRKLDQPFIPRKILPALTWACESAALSALPETATRRRLMCNPQRGVSRSANQPPGRIIAIMVTPRSHWTSLAIQKNFVALSIRALSVRLTNGGDETYVSDAIGE
jgi:hypothetical protein